MYKTKTLTLLLLALSFVAYSNSPTSINFINGSVNLAKNKAAVEGKLIFIDFTADWCTVCKFMDETTFRDHTIVSYLNSNYVPVKIDADDFDGVAYMRKFDVNSLPTFIILNSNGEEIGRYQKSIAPSNLIYLLEKYNSPENRRKYNVVPLVETQVMPTEVVSNPTPTERVIEDSSQETVFADPSPMNEKSSLSSEITDEYIIVDGEKVYMESDETVVLESIPDFEPFTSVQIPFEVAPPSVSAPTGRYTVQVGVFGDQNEMKKFMSNMTKVFRAPIESEPLLLDGKNMWRVYLGKFENRADAFALFDVLQQSQIDSFVKLL